MADIKEKYALMEKGNTLVQKQKELIKALNDYIYVLDAELKEIIGIAWNHGWESSRVLMGEAYRDIIDGLKKEIEWLEL
jgi:methionine salvage enolase-phosphatase E1